MPFYPFDENSPGGKILRAGLDNTRDGRYQLAHVQGEMQQMTDAQVRDRYGFADTTVAAAAKAELDSDIGKMLSEDTGINAAQVNASVVQMLNQFG